MKDLTLIVMAAGMGSRFGGPKQITPIGPSGEFIIDYSIYDAIKAGFTKVIFIIKKEHKEIFDETITKRLQNKIKIEYSYQEIENLGPNSNVPKDRTKPLGTAHAVLCAKDKVNEPFAIINADDFYGRDAYQKVADFLINSQDESEGVIISYPLNITTSKHGQVKRGVVEIENDYVTQITECSINIEEDKAICHPLNGGDDFKVEVTHPVSMNLFGFKPNFFDMLQKDFDVFIKKDKDYLEDAEIFLPDTVKNNIQNKKLKLKNIVSEGIWAGLTYKEDLPDLEEKINNLIEKGDYSNNLWNE